MGPARSSFVNAAGYLASALFIVPIVRLKEPPRISTGESARMILREIAEGVQGLWRNRATRRVAGLMGFLMAGAGASVVVGTVLIQQLFGSVTKDLGVVSLWLGIGMLLGTLAYGRWWTRMPHPRILGVAFLGCGTALWLFVAAALVLRSGTLALAAAALLGFWVAPVGIVANTLVHEGHPGELHGRIFSSLGVVINVSLIVSMLAAGWLVERGGKGLLLSGVGAGFALGGLTLLCYTKLFRKESSHG